MWEEVWKGVSKVHSGLPKAEAGRNVYPQEVREGEQAWERENEVVIEMGKKRRKKSESFGHGGDRRGQGIEDRGSRQTVQTE